MATVELLDRAYLPDGRCGTVVFVGEVSVSVAVADAHGRTVEFVIADKSDCDIESVRAIRGNRGA
jgi:hypothetical protein